MKSFNRSILFVVPIALVASFALAAPSLDITKGPVTPIPSWTGPAMDPDAVMGQWFLDLETGNEEVRTHEFYDNVEGAGGGYTSSAAIVGIPVNIQIDAASGGITAFDIRATITNDTPSLSTAEIWKSGSNSHGERLVVDDQYKGTLYDTKLTVEFAVDRNSFLNWLNTALPSLDPSDPYEIIEPLIVAEKPDELAWYCWTPDAPNPDQYQPTGDFLVPTYDFGDIKPGESVSRTLHFTVAGTGLLPGDPRYEVLISNPNDVFLNRTTSLKISNWIDMLAIDDGTPYPAETGQIEGALLNSDVSVFHTVPEPAVLGLAMMGIGLILCGRRRD